MRLFSFFIVTLLLSGCTWETYTNEQGRTSLRQKYEPGTGIVYEDGTYSRNMIYGKYRPVQHAISPNEGNTPEKAENTKWEEGNK